MVLSFERDAVAICPNPTMSSVSSDCALARPIAVVLSPCCCADKVKYLNSRLAE